MKLEQWGTFSVRDHIKPRAFVAEVILFDKLVIPRPATNSELYAEGETTPAEDQKARWIRKGWDPVRQRELLDILGEFHLAVELPWGNRANQDWQGIYNNSASDQMECARSDLATSIQFQVDLAKSNIPEEAAYVGTGGTLALYVANELGNKVARKLLALARTPGIPVEPVIAYGSFADFSTDQGIVNVKGATPPPATAGYAMFGWEFFVPADSEESDIKLLRKAAKFASRPDLRETRQSFQGWMKQMFDGDVDRQDAYKQMLKMLAEYKKIMRGAGLHKGARYAAKAASVLAPLAGLAGHGWGVGVGVAVSGVSQSLEWLLPVPQIPERVRPAAVLYDAKRFFR
jgi:hypothetical protein